MPTGDAPRYRGAIKLWVAAGLALFPAMRILRAGDPPTAPTYQVLADNPRGAAAFAVIGDLQQTMKAERLLFRESNPLERQALVRSLEAAPPAFLVIVGDLTNDGGSDAQWGYFDSLTAGLRHAGLPFVPVLGNHDYWFHRQRAMPKLAARFDQLGKSSWYARVYGRLGLVVLDANSGELTRAEWAAQRTWFDSTLQRFEHDSAIAGVLVFSHQPPFTNGTATSDDRLLNRDFVPRIEQSGKVMAMISGHTHSYEHFSEHGKQFIVTGGGGGPRVGLLSGSRRRHQDLVTMPAPRPFNYLWITPEPWGVMVEVRGLDKGETAIRSLDHFEIRW
ncbi:MAG TPA: metallophosphoesterase [Gemmatimonadales bacterium]|nr:metallophosphoesterase [Gemmatimonadales bacterium]